MKIKVKFSQLELWTIANSLADKGNELKDKLMIISKNLQTNRKLDNDYLNYALRTIRRTELTAKTYLKALEELPDDEAKEKAIKATEHNVRVCEESYQAVLELQEKSVSYVSNN